MHMHSSFNHFVTMAACTKFVRSVLDNSLKNKGHDWSVYGALNDAHSVVSATPGYVHLKFHVDKHNLNRQGTLNGGCISSLIDSAGSLAVSSHGLFFTGVSTDITTTFVKPIPYNEVVDIFARTASMGRTMAFTRVDFCSPESGKLLAYGSECNDFHVTSTFNEFQGHTKYIANSQGKDVCQFLVFLECLTIHAGKCYIQQRRRECFVEIDNDVLNGITHRIAL